MAFTLAHTYRPPAFAQALKELAKEGGVAARHQRYQQNQRSSAGMRALGFNTLLDDEPLAHYHRLYSPKTRSIALANFIAASKEQGCYLSVQSVAKRLLPHRQHWRSYMPPISRPLLTAIRTAMY